MRRILILTLLCLAATARGEESNYTRILAVMADSAATDEGYALGAGYGRKLHNIVPWMSLEAELIKNFTHMKQGTGSDQLKRSFWHTAAYTAFTYPWDRRFSIKGKVGMQYTAFRDQNGSNRSEADPSSNHGMSFGAGALIHLQPSQDVLLEYTTTTYNDYTQFLVGLQLHF